MPASYRLTRFAFLRGLGLIYLAGFVTLVRQWRPLIGSDGLLPARDLLSYVREQLGSFASGFWRLPSVFWLGSSDATLSICAWLGVLISLAAVLGLANAPLLAALWVLYLSFVHVGQIFYGYGWESLLCETGFLAIFLAPALSLKPFRGSVPWPVLFLLRWLSFRVMFGAGLIKMRGDSCWHDLSCLNYHYETQPLPNPFSAAYHHLPTGVHQLGVLFNHFVELVVPFGVFGPRRVRHAAGALIIVFQLCLISSGNLAFLNWLTIVITLSCFDDTVFERALPKRYRRAVATAIEPLGRPRRVVTGILLSLIGLLSLDPVFNLLSPRQRMNAGFDPFSLVNTYGAFGSVTRERNEIVLEGTSATSPDESARWEPFELPCKPGDPARRPCFVAPYQYKLDWQLWFAAFGSASEQPWLLHLVEKLLRGDPVVDPLFEKQPFRAHPPRYVRALFYRYRFAESGQQGAYWQRELLGEYLRPLSLADPAFHAYLRAHGFEAMLVPDRI
jgi:Lipase maturation factor